MGTKWFMGQKTFSVQTANCSKGFKRFQTMNKGLIKRNDRSFKKKTTTQESLEITVRRVCEGRRGFETHKKGG